MTGPNPVAQQFTKQATTPDNLALTITTTGTPVAGDVIVVKLATWGATDTMGAPTGGSQTFTLAKIVAIGGFNQWCAIYVCTVTGSPGNFAITSVPASSSRHSMEVDHFTAASLAGTPAVNSTVSGAGAAQASLTTTVDGSIISWVSGDVSSKDPATKVALTNNTFQGVRDDHAGANGVDYHGTMTTTTHGSYTFGMSAPTGQTFVIAGVEVLPGAAPGWTKDVVETYRVYASWSKDVVETYRITNAWSKDVVERYRVLNAWSKDVVERYRVFNAWTKDVVERYRVLNGWVKDVVDSYRVYSGWVKDVVETYNVASGTGWAKDVVERYRVFNTFSKDVVERYRVFAPWTKDVVERYRVLNGWTVDKPETYRVLNAWSRDVTERYRVLAPWSRDVVERYSVLTPDTSWSKDVVERYSVFNDVASADAIAYLGPLTATARLSEPMTVVVTLSRVTATAYLD